MKAAGAGALGLGAAGLASGLEIHSDYPVKYFNESSSQSNFEVDTSGVVTTNQIGTSSNPISDIHAGTVNAERVSSKRAYDMGGRYHGELTGSNDAQVVIDAINDRVSGASIVVSDPGFELDWEQQVDLPTENGFEFLTEGRPELNCINNSDAHALHVPKPSDAARARYMYIGPIRIGSTANLTTNWGISVDNIANSRLERPTCIGNGIHVQAPDAIAISNVLYQPRVYNPSGTAILMEDNQPSGGSMADANTVIAPQLMDGDNFTETAIIDRGNGNQWYSVDVQSAHTMFLADGARGYHVAFNYLDETFTRSVVEKNGAEGEIHLGMTEKDWKRLRIQSPATKIIPRTGLNEVTDYLAAARAVSPANSLADIGMKDASTGGGSVTIPSSPIPYSKQHIEMDTGGTSGDEAVLEHPARIQTSKYHPKIFGNITVPGSSISGSCVFRFGLHQNSDNYADIIYDPTGAITAGSSNWQIKVRTGGTTRDTVDTGITAGSGTTPFTINWVESGDWLFDIDEQQAATVNNGGSNIYGNLRWYLQTTDTSAENWRIRTGRALKFLTE